MAKPKLLLDENIGKIVVESLRSQDYNVLSVLESFPGAEDKRILETAVKEERIFITLDKDIGRLIYLYSQNHVGVIFLRLKTESAEDIIKSLLPILDKYSDKLKEKFTTISETRIRIR
jgi:predicted nuclease of predicted toxin-antitoxin system